MKKLFLFVMLNLCLGSYIISQTAIDFTLSDCSGTSRNLFSILDQGNVVVLVYEHQCGSCTQGAGNVKDVINTFYSSNPKVSVMYLDNGGNSCASVANWISTNSLVSGISFEYASTFSSPYGSGMPVIVVTARSTHKTYLISNGPSDTATIHNAIRNALNDTLSGLYENKNLNEFCAIFPNPVLSDKIVFSFNNSDDNSITIEITDVTGNIVKPAFVFNSENACINKEISVADLKAGIYFIRLYTKEGIFVKKIVKII